MTRVELQALFNQTFESTTNKGMAIDAALRGVNIIGGKGRGRSARPVNIADAVLYLAVLVLWETRSCSLTEAANVLVRGHHIIVDLHHAINTGSRFVYILHQGHLGWVKTLVLDGWFLRRIHEAVRGTPLVFPNRSNASSTVICLDGPTQKLISLDSYLNVPACDRVVAG